jgi:aspartate/tyrosine/aromatic aminotransferase
MLTMQLVQTIMSKSYLTEQNLKGQERVDFEKKLRSIIQDVDKTWIDEKVSSSVFTQLTPQNGVFEYSYNTDVIVCKRKA